MNIQIELKSTITCPHCGLKKEETMPTDSCQFFYECSKCGKILKPNAGDCCIYCSYGSVKCPPIQETGKLKKIPTNDKMDSRYKKERRFWDRFANYYDSFISKVFRESYASILENLESDLNLNHNVLDIGTGTGIIPFSICSKVSSIVATDISPKMIHIANQKLIKAKIQNIDFQIQDSYNLTHPDKSFDMVIASNLLHLIYEPEIPLKEVKRVMRDDGIFIAPTLCAGENNKSKIIASIIGTLSGFKVVNKWSINEFQKILIDNGFIITKSVIINDKIPLAYIVMKNITR